MELLKNRIAMVSPSHNAYSETFIQAQKNGLNGEIYYYYGGLLPISIEGNGLLNNDYNKLITKLKHKLRLMHFSSAELAFVKSLKKNKIQLVFAQYGNTAHRIVKICKYLNIPLITHFHGYDASVNSVIESCGQYKEVFEYSSYIISVSKVMEAKLLEMGCPREKLVYNPYGPNNDFFKVKPSYSSSTFIGIGRFVNKKAPYYTILAFNRVVQQYPDANLILAGNGELYEVCVNLVKQLKLEDNVFFSGVIDRKNFISYLENAIAFVQHSVTAINGDQEGTPVAVLEASAAGVPVIATRHTGISDVILENETGLLVDEHDVEGMANAMIQLLANKNFAKTLGEKGKERIRELFSMERHLLKLDEIVNKSIR